MEKVISVIIPVYNVSAYLPECLDSILNQSYQSLEIIVVDDGSTDCSGEICDEYALKDKRITVIHQKNGGAANAKNTGLSIATGYYLAFLDSDDYLEEGAYEHMVFMLEKYGADVVQCSYRDVFVNRKENRFALTDFGEFGVIDYLKRYTVDWTCGLLWDKLYIRSLFEGILFEEGHKIDDEFFTYRGIMNAKKIIYTPQVVYNYRKRKSGVMLSSASGKQIVLDKLDYLSKRRLEINARFPELKAVFDGHYANMLLILARDADVTEDALYRLKQLITEFLSEKPHPKGGLRLRIKLKLLQYQNVNKLMLGKKAEQPKVIIDCYFE